MRGAALYGEVRNAAAQENPEYLKVRVIFDQFTFKYDLEVLDERPVLHVYTNKPLLTADALPYAVVPLRSDGAEQARARAPPRQRARMKRHAAPLPGAGGGRSDAAGCDVRVRAVLRAHAVRLRRRRVEFLRARRLPRPR